MKQLLGDRRLNPRFDIVGELWGNLEAVVRFRVENIGPGGVFFYSDMPLPTDSVHQMTVTGGRQEFTTQVQVRRVRATPGAQGEPAFVIGAEFLGMSPGLLAEIREWAIEGEASDIDEHGIPERT